MVNASTRFNDGGELGLGAEMGISTTRIHAFGPMGVKSLTSLRLPLSAKARSAASYATDGSSADAGAVASFLPPRTFRSPLKTSTSSSSNSLSPKLHCSESGDNCATSSINRLIRMDFAFKVIVLAAHRREKPEWLEIYDFLHADLLLDLT